MASFFGKFKDKIGNIFYPTPYLPIGFVYISVNNINPGTIFGGTWEQIKDRFLLSAGSTYTAGSTGGEATHTLTANEMPIHTHTEALPDTWNIKYTKGTVNGYVSDSTNGAYAGQPYSSNYATGSAGGGAAHNNMPPYLTVYMWKRVK